MGVALSFMIVATIMWRFLLSWPGVLVAAYHAMQAGWRPILAAGFGLLCGNLAVLLIIPASTDTLVTLYGEPWPLLARIAAASCLVGTGFWLVYRSRRNRGFDDTPGAAVLAFLTGLVAQLGNFDAQLFVATVVSEFVGKDSSVLGQTKTLLFAFTIVETAALIALALMTKLLARPVRRTRVGAYLALMIVAAGVLLAVSYGHSPSDPPQAAAPAGKPEI